MRTKVVCIGFSSLLESAAP